MCLILTQEHYGKANVSLICYYLSTEVTKGFVKVTSNLSVMR